MEARPNHIEDTVNLIDRVLLEEGVVLDALKRAVAHNWLTQDDADAQFECYLEDRRG